MKLLCIYFVMSTFVFASDFLARPDGHAPIGVMGDHLHHSGEWMISTRVMHMGMSGIQNSTDELNKSEFFNTTSYQKYPKSMDMWMGMLGVMYAPSDAYTLMFMANYESSEMDMQISPHSGMSSISGMAIQHSNSTMKNDTLSNISLSALFSLWQSKSSNLISQVGLQIPSSEPNAKEGSMVLGYPMQHTSGSYDAKLGFTYTHNADYFSWGSQIAMVLPLGKNQFGYQVGTQTQLSSWIAKALSTHFSISSRLTYQSQARITGRHKNVMINTAMPMSPLIEASNSGWRRINAAVGINSVLGNFGRLALEFSVPLFQDFSGFQMPLDSQTTLGWQKAF